jgi:hypothetical protein
VILMWPKPGFIGQRENRGEEVKMKNPSASQRNWKLSPPFRFPWAKIN